MSSAGAELHLSTAYGLFLTGPWLRIIVVITFFGLLMGLGACGKSDLQHRNSKVATVQAVEWGVFKVLDERTIKIVSEVDHCVGAQKPWIKDVKVKEASGRATILVRAAFPQQQNPEGFCAGVGLFIYRIVRLNRALSDLRLYDAQANPPRLRWPRS